MPITVVWGSDELNQTFERTVPWGSSPPHLCVMHGKTMSVDTCRVLDGTRKALKASRRGPRVSHLFFADDLLLFGEAGNDQVECIKQGIELFCNASGQCMTHSKLLFFVSPNINEQEASWLSKMMGIPLMKELGNYLGHEILYDKGNKKLHSRILQKLNDRLVGWKARCLLRAGQITLAKSLMNSITTFYMLLGKLPSKIHKEIDR